MNTQISVRQLLQWRLARAESEAPPSPRASRLLELAKPWWERWPEKFQVLAEKLRHVEVGIAHAMSEPLQKRSGHLVPVLLVRTVEEVETSARVLYLDVRANRLRLRLQLDNPVEPPEPSFDVTFVSAATNRAFLSARAVNAMNHDYRIDAELPEEIASNWHVLKVTDEMPFRLILRSIDISA